MSRDVEVVTLSVTRGRIIIQAIGKEIIREEYARDASGQQDCVEGNFSDEPMIGDNDDLACGLVNILAVAAGIQDSIQ